MAEGASLAEQRESMDTASKNTVAARDAAAAQKRWRAFTSKVAAARRPRSVAAQRILQGLAPVGRVVVRARSTAQRVDIVRAALGASDAWGFSTDCNGTSEVLTQTIAPAMHGASSRRITSKGSAKGLALLHNRGDSLVVINFTLNSNVDKVLGKF